MNKLALVISSIIVCAIISIIVYRLLSKHSSLTLPKKQVDTPKNPLSIEDMRKKEYPGSAIVVEQTLAAESNYDRYLVSYKSDGLKIYGLLTVPSGPKPTDGWPVILLNHGYIPPAQYSSENSYAGVVQQLASAGYIVFKPDYRGNGNSEGKPTQTYVSPDYITDSMNALASIKKYKDADPNKIGVWSHSMGGNITLHQLLLTNDFKAAVFMAGVVGSYSNILDWWDKRVATGVLTTQNDRDTENLIQQLIIVHGTPHTNPDFWNALDPTFYLSSVKTPVYIQVGSADTVVPPDFSQSLRDKLQNANVDVVYKMYTGADHNLAPDTTLAIKDALLFFDKYLQN